MCIYTSSETGTILPDLQGTEQCACLNLRMTARAVTQLFDAALKPAKMRSTQFALLVMIAKLAPIAIGRLATILVIDRTTLTRSLHLMQKRDLVVVSHRSNMRQRFVTLSAKGIGELAQSLPFWRKAQGHLVDHVGEPHWKSMRERLEKLASIALSLEKGARVRKKSHE